MNLFLAFGLDIGNVGLSKAPRSPTKTLLADWNRNLSRDRELRLIFVNAYGHTGNYVLQASQTGRLEHVANVLAKQVPSYRFVVFAYTDFLLGFEPIRRALKHSPPAVPGRRWTPGIVMDANTRGGIPPLPLSDEKGAFGAFAVPRIRIVWKGDILDEQKAKLDNMQREGGWGSLSARMKKVTNGSWTARSIKSVEGLVTIAQALG